jgi:hypothetical protein
MRIAGEIVKYGRRRTPNALAISRAGVKVTAKLSVWLLLFFISVTPIIS